MDENMMWFGTREFMQYVPCPAIEGDHSAIGWSAEANYMNGGAWVRNSSASHRDFNLSWNLAHTEELQPLYDYASELYGPAPFYFIDPIAATKNVLPEWFAAPGMGALDAPLLVGETKPSVVMSANTSQGYPTRGATYTVTDALVRRPLFIPVPPGKVFWFGAHGLTNDASTVTVTPFNGPTAGTPVDVANSPVTSNVRVTNMFGNCTGVEISVSGEGNLSVFGMIGQILDIGVVPQNGRFIGGMGHSGVSFVGKPTKLAYSAAFDLIGASALLRETEAWR